MKSLINKFKQASKQEVLDISGNVLPHDALSDTAGPIRKGFWIIGVGFGFFILWASLAPIDAGTPSVGTLVVESHQKTIQHLSGGVIQEILVKEGDTVKENQVLIKMVSTTSDAQVGIYKHQADQLNTKLRLVKPMVDEGYFPKLEYLDLQRQAQEATLRLKVAQEELERTEVRAPMAGSVMGLAAVTVGGVVAPGGRLMSVIPEGDALVVEVIVPPHLIDKVTKGLEADIRFSALNQRTTPVVQGQVVWVSADRFTNQNANNPSEGYFTARVNLNADAMAKIGHQELKAGMPVDVIIKTGSRTFMSYLLKPFFDRAALSLKEM